MKGGSGKKAATQANLAANDNSPTKPKAQPKKERAYLYILANPQGATENDIQRNVGLSSGRNYFTDLERCYGFIFTREKIPNPDGISGHFKYSFASTSAAQSIIKAINKSRINRKLPAFTPEQQAQLLMPFNRSLGL